jgi:hypothetical protein
MLLNIVLTNESYTYIVSANAFFLKIDLYPTARL